MIFPKLTLENIVQVDDKTRLDGSLSFITKDEADITLVEIEPDTGAGFIDVTGNLDRPEANKQWYLDWAYSSDGDKSVTIRITTDGAPTTKTFTLPIISEADDRLFSNDDELVSHEAEILRYLKKGKSSYRYQHRRAQARILAWLDEHRIWKTDDSRFVKEDIHDIQEVKEWSIFETLTLIFEDQVVSVDDVFSQKLMSYKKLRDGARNRGALRLDRDGDGENERVPYDIKTARMVRR